MPGDIRKPSLCEIVFNDKRENLLAEIKTILDSQPLVDARYSQNNQLAQLRDKYDILLMREENFLHLNGLNLSDFISKQGFIIYYGQNSSKLCKLRFELVAEFVIEDATISLHRPTFDFSDKSAVIKVNNNNFGWMDELKMYTDTMNCKIIYLVSQNETNGILGLTNCLVSEITDVQFKAIILGDSSEDFSVNEEFYKNQIKKNLCINILKNNNWGTYIYSPYTLDESVEVDNASVNMTTAREFSTLKWVETPLRLQR